MPPPTVHDWPTYHGDAQRSGVYRDLPAWGRLAARTLKLDGPVYASPIVTRGVTIVATENDTLYALDRHGRQLWLAHLGTPARRADLPCGNIDPSGITGTPVSDGTTVYAAAEYRDPVRHELVAVSVRDGAVRWRMSLDLPDVDPRAMQQRGALALAAGRVWVPFGGRFGDCGDYRGRVIGTRLDGSGAIAYTVPTPREGGIWAAPGVVVDPAGQLLVAVGNGEHTTGEAYDYSDSLLAIDPATARLRDSFSPRTWGADNGGDLDLGSQGPALVGGRWVFIVGKSGTAYVLRQDRLGGIGGEVSSVQLCRSFGGTAVDGDLVYVPCDDGVRAIRIDASGSIHLLWHASGAIAGSPVVAGGRVWALDTSGGVLYGLDPHTGRSVVQVAVGQTSRFATPAVRRTQLLVPTLTGLAVVATSS